MSRKHLLAATPVSIGCSIARRFPGFDHSDDVFRRPHAAGEAVNALTKHGAAAGASDEGARECRH
jgi:hypothetical protein